MAENILIFNSETRPAEFGIGNYIKIIASAIVKRGSSYRVYVIVPYSSVKKITIEKHIHGYTILRIPKPLVNITTGQEDNKYLSRVVDIIRLQKWSLNDNIFHFNYFNHYKLARKCERKIGGKIILTIHQFLWSYHLNGNEKALDSIINKKKSFYSGKVKFVYANFTLEKKFLKISDQIQVLNSNSRKILESMYKVDPEKISVINNFIARYSKKVSKDIYERFNLSRNDKHIIYAGRLDEGKGIEFLIESFKIICQSYIGVKLIIVGDGHMSRYIEQSKPLDGDILFFGKLPQSQLYQLYQISNIGVLPSFYEQCSYVAIEMMMFGLSMVVSNCHGLREMFVDKQNALVVPINRSSDLNESIDFNLLADKIITLLEKRDLAKRLSDTCLQCFTDNYSEDKNINKLFMLYSRACHPTKARDETLKTIVN